MVRRYSFRLAPYDRVGQAIEAWRPRGCRTEKDYERSLVKKLREELVNETITPQYGSGRTRVDIMVHDKVPIEVKKDLTSTAAFQRTIGQLDAYFKTYGGVILVLCGSVSPDFLKELQKYERSGYEFRLYPV